MIRQPRIVGRPIHPGMVLLLIASWLMRRSVPGREPSTWAIGLSFAAAALAAIAAWLGSRIVLVAAMRRA